MLICFLNSIGFNIYIYIYICRCRYIFKKISKQLLFFFCLFFKKWILEKWWLALFGILWSRELPRGYINTYLFFFIFGKRNICLWLAVARWCYRRRGYNYASHACTGRGCERQREWLSLESDTTPEPGWRQWILYLQQPASRRECG